MGAFWYAPRAKSAGDGGRNSCGHVPSTLRSQIQSWGYEMFHIQIRRRGRGKEPCSWLLPWRHYRVCVSLRPTDTSEEQGKLIKLSRRMLWNDNWLWAEEEKVECVWNLMAHGDAQEGKWRGNWRMEWVAITLTLPRNVVYPALLPLIRTPRLTAVDWTDALADLNGLVRFGERRTLVSAHVPSHFKRTIQTNSDVVGWCESLTPRPPVHRQRTFDVCVCVCVCVSIYIHTYTQKSGRDLQAIWMLCSSC